MNVGLSIFYSLLVHICTNIVVFEAVLKERLKRFGNGKHVTIIPLGVEEFPHDISKSNAREQLHVKSDDFVMIAFGFLAWYKGTDWLVDAYEIMQKTKGQSLKTKLILAGGPNFQRLHFPFYKTYVESIEKKCVEYGITITGFIDEKDIPLYFQAADVLLFPYRTLMSSSGPLTISYSFHTPFLFSKPLAPILRTEDLRVALEAEHIKPEDIIFSDKEDFIEKITTLSQDRTLLKKLSNVSTEVAKKRSWEHIGEQYYNVVFN